MKNQSVLITVLKHLRKYVFGITASCLLAAVTVAASLYVPIVIGNAIDCIAGKGDVDFDKVYIYLVRTAVVIGFGAIASWLMASLNNRITTDVVRDIRREAFEKITVLPLSYIDSHQNGDIVSRVISDVDTFADGLLMGFTQLFSGVLTILGTLFFMFSIKPLIAVIVMVLTPLSMLTANFIAKKTYSMFRVQAEMLGKQTSFIDETLGNQKTVKAFSHEERSKSDFDSINNELEKASLKAVFFSSLVNPSTRFINNLVYASVALSGAFFAISGSMTVGMLSCFLSYANQYTKPFNEISGVITELQNAFACASRIFDLINEKPRVPDKESSVDLGSAKGNVDMENVSFSYTESQKLLENLNLSVKNGQRVAIVGPTGCGKTTIINLLMRFYDVNTGSIKVDGHDIRDVKRRSLRQNYGMVLQDTWLKSGTIRENITLGKPHASDSEVLQAAKSAHSYSFIRRLPNGFDTYIGEDGGMLSQGQKQLLCITRVMLCLPPMLILDEATSSIDTRTEQKIQQAFAEMTLGRTSFVVAHRLSTIQSSDVILVMKSGNIIEQGTHNELLEKGGFYKTLFTSQFE